MSTSRTVGLAILGTVMILGPSPTVARSTGQEGRDTAAAFLDLVRDEAFTATATVGGELEVGSGSRSLKAPLSGTLRIVPGGFFVDATATVPGGTRIDRRLIHSGSGSWFTISDGKPVAIEDVEWIPDPMTWGPSTVSVADVFEDVHDASVAKTVTRQGRDLARLSLPGLDPVALGRAIGLVDPDPAWVPKDARASVFVDEAGSPLAIDLDLAFEQGLRYRYRLALEEFGGDPAIEAPVVDRWIFAPEGGGYRWAVPTGWDDRSEGADIPTIGSMNGPTVGVLTMGVDPDASPEERHVEGLASGLASLVGEGLGIDAAIEWQPLEIDAREARIASVPFEGTDGAAQLALIAVVPHRDGGLVLMWRGSGWGARSQMAFFRDLLEGLMLEP